MLKSLLLYAPAWSIYGDVEAAPDVGVQQSFGERRGTRI
jgi:hypothetical protein